MYYKFLAINIVLTASLFISQITVAQDSFPEFKFTGYADARLSYSSGEQSWFDRGVGKTRYGSDAAGHDEWRFNLAEAALLVDTKFSWDFSAFANFQFDPEQKNNVDVVEAFIRYNKLLSSGYRLEARLGIFYPHISLENYGVAWTSPYSITPSAINSWVGEEVKTTGLELNLEKELSNDAISINVGLFGFNDTSGTLLFFRGWALHDNKTSVFGKYYLPDLNIMEGMFNRQDPYTVPHIEVDNRPGYLIGGKWEHFGYFTIDTLYYDNRADPAVLQGGQYGWESDFINIGLTIDYFEQLEIFGQFMKGNTKMGPDLGFRPADADYESYYVMVSHPFGPHRLSLRYDTFKVIDNTLIEIDNNNETGHAWMIAYAVEIFEQQNLVLETLHVNSDRFARSEFTGNTRSKETQIQASYRIVF